MPELKHEEEFDVGGPQTAPSIIFLHGSSETRRMWTPQTISLADAFHIVAVDLPAHGALAKVPFRMAAVVAWLSDLVDRVAGGRCVVAGISLGGYVAMEFGAKHPEKTAGLVLLSCTAEPTGPGAALYWMGTWLMEIAPLGWLAALKRLGGRMLYSPEFTHLLTGYHFRGGAQGIREVLWKSYLEKVRSYPGPILFINGRRDLPFRSSEQRFLAAARRGQLELIPRAYHVCNLDNPTAVSAAIRRFASSV